MDEALRDIRKVALGLNLCSKYTDKWGDNTPAKQLLSYYQEAIDFCLMNNFPTADFLRNYVTDDTGIYVDRIDKLHASQSQITLLGDCKMKIEVNDCTPTIFVCHQSELFLEVYCRRTVSLRVLDYAKVHIKCYEGSTVFVHRYSDNCSVEHTGKGRVIDNERINFYREPIKR